MFINYINNYIKIISTKCICIILFEKTIFNIHIEKYENINIFII